MLYLGSYHTSKYVISQCQHFCNSVAGGEVRCSLPDRCCAPSGAVPGCRQGGQQQGQRRQHRPHARHLLQQAGGHGAAPGPPRGRHQREEQGQDDPPAPGRAAGGPGSGLQTSSGIQLHLCQTDTHVLMDVTDWKWPSGWEHGGGSVCQSVSLSVLSVCIVCLYVCLSEYQGYY